MKKKNKKKANERASVSECTDVEQLKESSTGCKDELTECKTLRMVGFGGMALCLWGQTTFFRNQDLVNSLLTTYEVNIV